MKTILQGVGLALACTFLLSGCPGRVRTPEKGGPVVRLGAVGDIMLGRGVAGRSGRAGDPGYPFRDVGAALLGYDLAFGNLECALTRKGTQQWKGLTFRASPDLAGIMRTAGFSVLALANNHAWDYGPDGFADTLAALEGAGIGYAGVSDDRGRGRLLVTPRNGVRIGWLAYCDGTVDRFFSRTFVGKVGIALLDEARIGEEIRSAARKVDFLIVSLHWGVEYRTKIDAGRRRLARAIADGGADLILGHHPHVLQGVEVWRGRLIAYSLGNFVFDQKTRIRNESVVLEVDIARTGVVAARLRPVRITAGRPRIATGETGLAIMTRMREMSAALDTKIEVESSRHEVAGRVEIPGR